MAYLHEKNINAYIPNFGQYKAEREGFTFNKEENYYQCTKPEGNQAKLLFKGEKTDSKGYTKHTYEAVNRIVKTVHSENLVVVKVQSLKN